MPLVRPLLVLCILLCGMGKSVFGQPATTWRVFKALDGLAESSVTSIHLSPRGHVWTAHPAGKEFSRLDGYDVVRFPAPGDGCPISESRSGQIWSYNASGLLELTGNSWISHPIFEISTVAKNNKAAIPLLPIKQGRVLVMLPEKLLEFNNEWVAEPLAKVIRPASETSLDQFIDMIAARDGGVWISGTKGLIKSSGAMRNISRETMWQEVLPTGDLGINNFQNISEDDSGGVTVMAMRPDGKKVLAYFNGNSWNVYVPSENPIKAIRDVNGVFWFITGTGLFTFDPKEGQSHRNIQISATQFFDIVADSKGAFWVATSEGLFRFAPLTWTTTEKSAGKQHQVSGGEKLETVFNPPLPEEFNRKHTFEARLQNGDVWVGSSSGIARLRDDQWEFFQSTDSSVPSSAFCMVELGAGKIWVGGEDKIWEFDGKKWSLVQGGFGRVNAIIKTRDAAVWVASDSGIYNNFQNQWIQNGSQEGLPSEIISSLVEDNQGKLQAGTVHGVSLYFPDADVDAPRTEILPAQQKQTSTKRIMSFRGKDKWKFSPEERLLFSYRLDEHDWSLWQSTNAVIFSDLSAGTHYFQVRSMDRNLNIDFAPARLEFAVILPWYKEIRLLWIAAFGSVFALFFAGVAFNRHIQLRRSYAEVEKIVALRTEQLEKAHQELLHSQKMNALGTLAAGIAHDFNNILSIIKGSVQIIESNLDKPEKIQTRVARIKMVVDQGAGIIKAMLGFGSGTKQATSCGLDVTVFETIRLLGDRFLHEVEVVFEPVNPSVEVVAPKEFIQQILLNLIFNAADAMDGHGKIRVHTGKKNHLPKQLALRPAPSLNYVFVSVQDFGCGISAEILPRIFEPFFTTKGFSARRGTGLGLSMVYELAREIGCGLQVESTENTGSTFTLYFPMTASVGVNETKANV